MRRLEACPLAEPTDGSLRLVQDGPHAVGVYNLDGQLYALEDRCSHDDGPLCEGEFDAEAGIAICPRHGARFDIRTGKPLSLPATQPVDPYPVHIHNGHALIELTTTQTAA